MARHPEQALYVCDACYDRRDPECQKCGGGGYLNWESLTPEEQDAVRDAWTELDGERLHA